MVCGTNLEAEIACPSRNLTKRADDEVELLVHSLTDLLQTLDVELDLDFTAQEAVPDVGRIQLAWVATGFQQVEDVDGSVSGGRGTKTTQ